MCRLNRKNQLAVGFNKVHEEISKIPLVDRLSKPFQIMEQYVNDEEIGEVSPKKNIGILISNKCGDPFICCH